MLNDKELIQHLTREAKKRKRLRETKTQKPFLFNTIHLMRLLKIANKAILESKNEELILFECPEEMNNKIFSRRDFPEIEEVLEILKQERPDLFTN